MNKNKTRKIFLIICVFLLGIVAINLNCEWPWQKFKRNTNLKLIKSERGAYTLFYPVFTPEGTHIYYLRGEGVLVGTIWGNLWKMNNDGTNAVEVLRDTFCALAIASNGQKIAITTGSNVTGGKLLLFDSSRLTVDTIQTSHTDIFAVAFSRKDTNKIYFCSMKYGIYLINLNNSAESLITPLKGYFDLTSSDSIIIGVNRAVHPSQPYIIVPNSIGNSDDLILINTESMDTTYLDANPYQYSWIKYTDWAPDGNKVIFTAYENKGDPLRSTEGEIWILENIFSK